MRSKVSGHSMKFDVAIIGGGPAGSTVGTLLKLLHPELKVGIFEGSKFPRDHVGESLLPATCEVLHELNVWDKVEKAGFPVKLGGLYRWGVTDEIYSLAFLQGQEYQDPVRPAKYDGQRALTTFQVDLVASSTRFSSITQHSMAVKCLKRRQSRPSIALAIESTDSQSPELLIAKYMWKLTSTWMLPGVVE